MFQRCWTGLTDVAAGTGVFPLAGIRCRALPRDSYRVADGHPDNGFVHVELRVGAGRDVSTLRRAGEAGVRRARRSHGRPVGAAADCPFLRNRRDSSGPEFQGRYHTGSHGKRGRRPRRRPNDRHADRTSDEAGAVPGAHLRRHPAALYWRRAGSGRVGPDFREPDAGRQFETVRCRPRIGDRDRQGGRSGRGSLRRLAQGFGKGAQADSAPDRRPDRGAPRGDRPARMPRYRPDDPIHEGGSRALGGQLPLFCRPRARGGRRPRAAVRRNI